MRQKSWIGTLGVLFLASLSSCTTEPVFDVVMDGNFVAPVAQFDPLLDAALWDDTAYGGVVVATPVAQVTAVPAAARLPRPLGSLFASLGAVVPASCVPDVAFVDNDQDGIPASYTATFNCFGGTAGTARVTGRVSIVDNNDNSPNGGLTVTFNSFVIGVSSTAGAVVGRTFEGTLALTPGPNGTFNVQQNLTTIFPSADPATPQLLDTYVSNENGTYTPDPGVTDPFSSGTAALDGSGKLTATFNGDSSTRGVDRSTNPNLHWNRSCRTTSHGSIGYDSGTLIYKLEGDGRLNLLFSGCAPPVQAISQK